MDQTGVRDAITPAPMRRRSIRWSDLRALRPILAAQWTFRRATRISWTARLWGSAHVFNEGVMLVGDKVRLRSVLIPSEFVAAKNARLEIGAHTFINYAASISAHKQVRIGAYCMIGTHCIIMDNDYHHVGVGDRYAQPESQPVILGDHVWLGARVTILKGVTIGDYAVIGAGSVVTRDIPSYSVAAGVPARVIRTIDPLQERAETSTVFNQPPQ